MEYIAQAKDYWIAPQAVKITLNALGNPHRTQATVTSGAVIMCYIKGVDGLEYDNGHQYRAWNISASPTYFNTATKKYVYAAIPRSSEVGVQAVIVYPSELLDIYGCNENGDQIGSEHFYYIWLQGVISESAYNRANRYWLTDIDYGILATDEARDDQSYNTDWYTFNAVTQTVTFLKEIIMKAGSSFRNLILGGHNLTGVATGDTPEDIDSDTLVVTPNYIRNKFLHKDRDDTTPYSLTIEQELRVGNRGIMNHLQSTDYTGDGMLDSGYKLWYEEGRAKLVIDDLVARGKFTVNELETRIWTYAGGNMVFSGAGSTIFFVEYLDANENPLGYTYINQPWLLRGRALLAASLSWSKRRQIQRQLTDTERAAVVKFRCYEFSDDGTMQTRNWWHTNDIAMCQSLNKVDGKTNSDGSYSGALSNTVYKRRIAGIGSKEIPMLNDGRVYDYVDLWNIYDVYGQTYINSQGQTVTITDSVKGFQNMAPSGATPSTDWPAAGDVIVQMGNPLDTDRQAAVTIEVQGDVHGFKVYDTISDYSMENKLWVEIGYDQTTSKAKANVYGDFRFGCRENEEAQGGSYIKYNRTTKQLDIKAKINMSSPLGDTGKTFAQTLTAIEGQIDKKAETWRQSYRPNYLSDNVTPDPTWVDSEHVGDIWMDISANGGKKTYIYIDKGSGANPRYVWEAQDVPEEVFDDIDGKGAIYSGWEDWIDASGNNKLQERDLFIPLENITVSGVTYKAMKVYKCITAGANPVFSEVDYTDDTKVDNLIANQYVSYLLNGSYDTDIANAAAAYTHDAALNAVKGALKSNTVVEGGLMLTSLIALRQLNSGDPDDPSNYTTWAGISGEYVDRTTPDPQDPSVPYAKGHGIAAWYGGAMIDYEMLTPEQQADGWGGEEYNLRWAKGLDRMDGSGYRANGNISWNAAGDLTIKGQVVTATTKIDTPAIFLNGTDITATLNAILGMFELDTTTEPGTTLIKAKYSLYSVGDVSALGNSSGGGGGGGGGASVLYELNDVLANAGGTSVLDAQAGYVLTCVENGGSLKWKAAPTAPTYVLPQATSSALGGIKIGFTASEKNYAVQLDDSGKAYVNVPWTDHYNYIAPKSEITYNVNYLQYDDVYATEASNPANAIGNPTADWYHHIVMNHANSGGYFVDMALCFHSNDFYYRRIANGVANAWVRVLDSSNSSVSKSGSTLTVKINGSSESITDTNTWRPLGTGASDACAGNDSRLSDSRPASDVYSWAKAATKPSYTLDEVSDGTTRKLSNYLPLTGGSLSGALVLAAGQYNGYKTGSARSYGLNANNSDIIGINSLITADLSDGWNESIGFARTNGHYDTFRAADGVFYFGFNGYYDSDNVEHAASEIIQIKSTGSIECVRADSSDSRMLVSNTNSSGNSVMLLASTNRGLYLENKGWIIASDSTNCWSAFGNFGIGTTSPSYRLHVSGDIYATGDVTAASDERQKCNIEQIDLSVEQIAKAPAVKFSWKDGRDNLRHVGTFAQYWQKALPESVTEKNYILGMNYGTAALVSVVKVAEKVLTHEEKIEQLKKRVRELEHEVERLKSA